MSLFKRRSSPTAHWSKDFIEHLRTVHFTLIVLAVIAIISGRAPDLAKMRTARSQLNTIRDFIDNKRSMINTPQGLPLTWVIDKSRRLAAPLPTRESMVSHNCSPIENSRHDKDQLMLSDLRTRVIGNPPDSLESFRDLWDMLNCASLTIYLITEIAEGLYPNEGTLVDYRKGVQPIAHLAIIQSPKDALIRSHMPIGTVSLRDSPWDQEIFKHMKFVRIIPDDIVQHLDIYNSLFTPGNEHHMTFTYDLNSNEAGVSRGLLLTHAVPNAVLDGHHMLNMLESAWTREGAYAQCFAELVDVAFGKENYRLKDLGTWLDEEISNAEPRQIDIFGIRFPADSQAQWGLILTVIVLLYFWMHLRELSPRLKADHSGLEVAWPGLYRSWIAYAVMWATVVFLPLYALWILALNRVHYKPPWRSFVASNWRDVALWVATPLVIYSILSVWSCLELRRLAVLADTARKEDEDEPVKQESSAV